MGLFSQKNPSLTFGFTAKYSRFPNYLGLTEIAHSFCAFFTRFRFKNFFICVYLSCTTLGRYGKFQI